MSIIITLIHFSKTTDKINLPFEYNIILCGNNSTRGEDMKKLALIMIIICLGLVTYCFRGNDLSTVAPDNFKYAEVYSSESTVLAVADKQSTAGLNIYKTQDVKGTLKRLNSTLGIAYTYSLNDIDLAALISKLGVRKIKEEYIGNLYCYYGYTNKIKGGIVIDGNKINIQIVSSNGTLKLASPMIMGSY